MSLTQTNQSQQSSGSPNVLSHEEMDRWFSEFIEAIKVDHLMLETEVAPKEIKDLYTGLIKNDFEKVMTSVRQGSTQFFIRKIVFEYVEQMKSANKKPIKLALGISDSTILVWAEIEDNDDSTEDALLIAEAKTNGKFYQHGFYINSTIVEESDHIPVPPHYQSILK